MKIRSMRGRRRTHTWGSERLPPPPVPGHGVGTCASGCCDGAKDGWRIASVSDSSIALRDCSSARACDSRNTRPCIEAPLPRDRPSLGACPTLTVILRRTIRDHLRRSRPEQSSMYSSEYTSGFSRPAGSHLAAPPAPRPESNTGQAPRVWILCGIPWRRVNRFEC
jgi:hypothetical protein